MDRIDDMARGRDITRPHRERSAHIFVLNGTSTPSRIVPSNRREAAVHELQQFVVACPDVTARRFDHLLVQMDDGKRIRGSIVHALVECGPRTFAINVCDDLDDAFWTTVLLGAVSAQLGIPSEIVTSVALECSSPRLETLLAVAGQQHVRLDAWDVERIRQILATRKMPTLADVCRSLDSATRSHAKPLAAVANGMLRLAPHDELSGAVRVYPGPMLEPTQPTRTCGTRQFLAHRAVIA